MTAPSRSESSDPSDLLRRENLLAWCTVEFDAKNRGPAARIEMLQGLGFTQYAYDAWTLHRIEQLPQEIEYARKAAIKIAAAWIWIDPNYSSVGELSEANQKIMKAFADAELSTVFWIGFHPQAYADLEEKERFEKGRAMVDYLAATAESIGCTIALYNHGGWFGEVSHQIALIEACPDKQIGIVYNFFHGRHETDRFAEVLEKTMPYLTCVNPSGVSPEAKKVVPLGEGSEEANMLRTLLRSNFQGKVGIIGHSRELDVEKVLATNLSGLKALKRAIDRD